MRFFIHSVHVYCITVILILLSASSLIMGQLSFSKDWRAGGKRSFPVYINPRDKPWMISHKNYGLIGVSINLASQWQSNCCQVDFEPEPKLIRPQLGVIGNQAIKLLGKDK